MTVIYALCYVNLKNFYWISPFRLLFRALSASKYANSCGWMKQIFSFQPLESLLAPMNFKQFSFTLRYKGRRTVPAKLGPQSGWTWEWTYSLRASPSFVTLRCSCLYYSWRQIVDTKLQHSTARGLRYQIIFGLNTRYHHVQCFS